jgi:hypothetical protein
VTTVGTGTFTGVAVVVRKKLQHDRETFDSPAEKNSTRPVKDGLACPFIPILMMSAHAGKTFFLSEINTILDKFRRPERMVICQVGIYSDSELVGEFFEGMF